MANPCVQTCVHSAQLSPRTKCSRGRAPTRTTRLAAPCSAAVGGPPYGVHMAEESTTRRLRVVREARPVDIAIDVAAEVAGDLEREDYWARLEELRAERARLLAG